MFAIVTLENGYKHIVVPIKWIKDVNLNDNVDAGVNNLRKHILFYSSDKTKSADFKKEIKTRFDSRMDNCYFAYVVEYFGKL